MSDPRAPRAPSPPARPFPRPPRGTDSAARLWRQRRSRGTARPKPRPGRCARRATGQRPAPRAGGWRRTRPRGRARTQPRKPPLPPEEPAVTRDTRAPGPTLGARGRPRRAAGPRQPPTSVSSRQAGGDYKSHDAKREPDLRRPHFRRERRPARRPSGSPDPWPESLSPYTRQSGGRRRRELTAERGPSRLSKSRGPPAVGASGGGRGQGDVTSGSRAPRPSLGGAGSWAGGGHRGLRSPRGSREPRAGWAEPGSGSAALDSRVVRSRGERLTGTARGAQVRTRRRGRPGRSGGDTCAPRRAGGRRGPTAPGPPQPPRLRGAPGGGERPSWGAGPRRGGLRAASPLSSRRPPVSPGPASPPVSGRVWARTPLSRPPHVGTRPVLAAASGARGGRRARGPWTGGGCGPRGPGALLAPGTRVCGRTGRRATRWTKLPPGQVQPDRLPDGRPAPARSRCPRGADLPPCRVRRWARRLWPVLAWKL